MDNSRLNPRSDWAIAQLPTLFIRCSPNAETVRQEALQRALITREHIAPDTADLVIQSALDDGIIERKKDGVLRLLETRVTDQVEEGSDVE